METPYKKKVLSESQIEEAFRNEMPYFYELQRTINETPNGQVSVTVRMYKGKVQDYVVTTSIKKRVS